jgi:prepilin-type N-terminal cleavage/methylation domain-containing protein
MKWLRGRVALLSSDSCTCVHVAQRRLALHRSRRLPERPPSRALRGQHAHGFTLVEVVVAVVIAALCFSALAGVFATGTRSASVASELARASTLAQSLLATAGVDKPLVDGTESGSTADGLNWTVTIGEESSDSEDTPIKPTMMLKRVTARVVVANDAQPDRARAFELSTLRAAPRPILQ